VLPKAVYRDRLAHAVAEASQKPRGRA
jgi:hypothetical protein